jgi:predicted CXXCH cytochrome family protein
VGIALAAVALVVAGCGGDRRTTASARPMASGAAGPRAFTGSTSCQPCHAEIYARWKKTPMANVVRDPKVAPEAILPDLSTNTIAPFAAGDIALVYGSLWKQRYFVKRGDDYFPAPVQWDVQNKVWRKYFVEAGTDWWASLYPPDNAQRPTGPLCDGCHSVGYDVKTKTVAEWNVGCERCHGGGVEHVGHATRTNIVNPRRMDSASADDTCIQCHSQGRPLHNPIEGRYYDWPVGYSVGLRLSDHWRLEEHTLGVTSFTHYADGTAHKNRMQGNDYVQSKMSEHGIRCFDCHEPHGSPNTSQLRRPGNALCLGCHTPGGRRGPREDSVSAHTGHAAESAGSECVACHMPKIETTIADVKVHAHTFKFISPEETDRQAIPNPCTSCHRDRSTKWAAGILAARARAATSAGY